MKLLIPLGYKEQETLLVPVVAPLLSFILSTIIVYLTNAKDHSIDIVKQVQEGLNPSSVHQLQFNGSYVDGVAKIGFIVAVVALTVGVQFYKSIYNSNK